jgi:hypothetical protein
MRKIVYALCIGACLALSVGAVGAGMATDAQIRGAIIQESLRSYPGNCPCPYNSDRAGRRCGKRSAWSRAGGYSPVCFANEVSDDQVRAYRTKHGLERP